MALTIRKPYRDGPKVRVSIDPEEGRTKQSFKDDCDINFIVKKYVKSGQMPYIRENGVYADHTATDLFESMQIVAKSKTMFEELPAAIRNRFENDPVKFLEFTEDPTNQDEMIDLGLATRTPVVDPQKVEVVNASPPPNDRGVNEPPPAEA